RAIAQAHGLQRPPRAPLLARREVAQYPRAAPLRARGLRRGRAPARERSPRPERGRRLRLARRHGHARPRVPGARRAGPRGRAHGGRSLMQALRVRTCAALLLALMAGGCDVVPSARATDAQALPRPATAAGPTLADADGAASVLASTPVTPAASAAQFAA